MAWNGNHMRFTGVQGLRDAPWDPVQQLGGGSCTVLCSLSQLLSQPTAELQQHIFKNKIREFKAFTLSLAMPSLPFSGAVFRLWGAQKLCSALGSISRSQVRPMPKATGNLILIFFRCCGFLGRSGQACPGVGSVFQVLPW